MMNYNMKSQSSAYSPHTPPKSSGTEIGRNLPKPDFYICMIMSPISLDMSRPVSPHRGVVSPFSSSKSAYDDSRIQDHPDKKLLRYIRNYFEAFVGADFENIAKL
ncbi:hypothetical protein GJ744_012416 [Endocarpon pusillum]|uniref:Uncharacterized protein n=1 Tax=Endocarpon pusillum TaxID=364733 RepID=A0A8H7AEY8_9EURO|nr:hypothetical protein GJ744_012416 [Endocarpon pusillum]